MVYATIAESVTSRLSDRALHWLAWLPFPERIRKPVLVELLIRTLPDDAIDALYGDGDPHTLHKNIGAFCASKGKRLPGKE